MQDPMQVTYLGAMCFTGICQFSALMLMVLIYTLPESLVVLVCSS